MKYILALVSFSLFSVGAQAYDTKSCSNSNGDLVLDFQDKSGGPFPIGCKFSGHEFWSYKGKVISAVDLTEGPNCRSEPSLFSRIDSSFSKIHVLASSGSIAAKHTVFSAEVTLKRSDGSAVLPDGPAQNVVEFVICTDDSLLVP